MFPHFPSPGIILLALAATASAAEEKVVSFSGPPGPYALERWKQDWPGCRFEGGIRDGRVSLVQEEGTRWLRVSYAPGQIGPDKGGAGWRWPVGQHEVAEAAYTVRFAPDFDWVKGGKLPGLCGGPENVSGGRPATGQNGFSARLMWRKDGKGEAYVYHKHQPGRYGDRMPFPEDFRFPAGKPVAIRIRVSMNQPGKRDGGLQVWAGTAGSPVRLLVNRQDMEWRDTAAFGIDSLYFETFHGGSDASWAPSRACWADFSGPMITFPDKDAPAPPR